jgi:hypothetical protein
MARLFALRARIHMAIWLSKGLRCSQGAGGPKLWALPIVAVSKTGDSDQLPRSFAVARGTYAIKILATNTAHVKTFGQRRIRSERNFLRGPTGRRDQQPEEPGLLVQSLLPSEQPAPESFGALRLQLLTQALSLLLGVQALLALPLPILAQLVALLLKGALRPDG